MFKFRLQKQIDLIYNREKTVKEKLLLKNQELNQEEEKLNNLQLELSSTYYEFRGFENMKTTVPDVLTLNENIAGISLEITILSSRIAQIELEINNLMEELLKERTERKKLEKLKEKNHQKYIMEENKREQKLIDESTMFQINLNKE